MNIITTYPETLDKRTTYKITHDQALKMSDNVGTTIQVDAFILYEEINSKGEEQTVLAVQSGAELYATTSSTFIKSFNNIYDMFKEEGFSVTIIGGTSKSNRPYIDCFLA